MSAIYKLSIISIVAIMASCSKEPPIVTPPTVSTISASSITNTSATLGGNITNDGGSTITERGIFLGKEQNPETTGEKWGLTIGINNSFSGIKTGLTPNTTYYVKAYAINGKGTGYGNLISFTTTASPATITTSAVTSITASSALSGGTITDDGGATISSRGVCWSISQNPTIENNKTSNGTGKGIFISNVTGLTANTTYYIRAYATNITGTAYAIQSSFKTFSDAVPTVSTINISTSLLSSTSAFLGGSIIDNFGLPIIERGIYYGTEQNPDVTGEKFKIEINDNEFEFDITGLNPSTTYYFKAYATNVNGIGFGSQLSFKTLVKDFIEIGGVKWAKYNINAPGNFVENEYDYGMYYQWNRWVGWSYQGIGTIWDEGPAYSNPSGQNWSWDVESSITEWQDNKDPCPYSWRVPTINEFQILISNVQSANWYTLVNDKTKLFYKMSFGNNQELLLPGAGYRDWYGSGAAINKSELYAYYWARDRKNVFAVEKQAIKYYIFDEQHGLLVRCVKK